MEEQIKEFIDKHKYNVPITTDGLYNFYVKIKEFENNLKTNKNKNERSNIKKGSFC